MKTSVHRHSTEANSIPVGTLLWIGERDGQEYREVFDYCESLAPQLAVRRDVQDCLDRPAQAVAGIVFTRQTRDELCSQALQYIRETYADATMIQLLGSLCAGERPREVEPFGEKTIYWHQWNQYLPDWLSECGIVSNVTPQSTYSVAVVASSLASAQPLMDLAASAGAATIWCKRANRELVRNVDAVWWDESAARPTTSGNWRDRIAEMALADGVSNRLRRCRHVWLASWPRRDQIRAAIDGGVELVISKPFEVSLLYRTLEHQSHTEMDYRSNEASKIDASPERHAA